MDPFRANYIKWARPALYHIKTVAQTMILGGWMTFVQSGAATMNGKRNRKWSMISREKIDALCVKNATKTKIGLRAYCLAGLPFSPLNNAFFGFVALSHVLENELK